MAKALREIYSETIEEIAKKDKDVFVLESDLSSSMSTSKLKNTLKEQYINVGIMEANMIGVAAGISLAKGFSFSHTFAQFMTRRAFDQIFISLAYAKQNACLVGSDAGVSAVYNGGTHMPFEDLALMMSIPNCTIYDVCDGEQLKYALYKSYEDKGLTYIRTTRKDNANLYDKNTNFEDGFIKVKEGKNALILACGIMVSEVIKASNELEKDGYNVTIIDIFRLKPLNEEKLLNIIEKFDNIVVCENHGIQGGLNSIISLLLATHMPKKIKSIAVYGFGQVGSEEYLKEFYNISYKDIMKKVLE